VIESPVLITGGSGYIASRLMPQLAGANEIRVLSRRAPRPSAAIRWIEGHTGDAAALEEAIRGARTIFHLAAQTSVAVARENPQADYDANVTGLTRMLDGIGRTDAPPVLILAGTVTQCGIPLTDTLDERAPDQPITVYDAHKLEAERALEAAARSGVVHGVTLRLANVYGPGARSGAADRGVLNKMIRLAAEGLALSVYGDGAQLRDYTFVDDVAAAFVKAAGRAADISGRHFVVGTGQRRTLAEAAALVAHQASRKTGRQILVEHVPPPPSPDPIDFRSYIVDAAAFRGATGWRPTVDLETGVDRTLDWIAGRAAQ
jgi:UDP-glucose 4-epimerase